MANIIKHIEHLLLTNDCVILPDFGGFIAHHVSAHFDEKESVFIPAQRSLGFNPRLTMNDSILVQSYIETYAMSYPDALKELEQDIEEIRLALSEKGSYDFGTVGTLTMGHSGYDFQPHLGGLLTPSLYGFNALEVHTLEMLQHLHRQNALAITGQNVNTVFVNNGEKTNLFDKKSNEEPPYVITIQRKTVRRAMMTAAAIALALVVSLPVKFSMSQNGALLQSSVTTTLPTITPAKEVEKSVAVKVSAKAEAKPVVKKQEVKTMEKLSVTIDENNYYSIVMANGITRQGAEFYASQLLQDDGIKTIITDGAKPMVLFGKFATAEDAQAEIAKHKECKKFDIAWVYNVKSK